MSTEEPADYFVVVNHEEQYSIWPVDRGVPLGWTTVGPARHRDEVLNHIEELWTDQRPRSLRAAMKGPTTVGWFGLGF